MSSSFDVDRIRSRFPGLARMCGDGPTVFFDGPGGSQVPQSVIDAVCRYMAHDCANTGGAFATSQATDRMTTEARAAVADLLGAPDPDAIVFGANMTSLTFLLSRVLARTWQKGDEVVVTQLDHDANVTPWVRAAESVGARVRFVPLVSRDCTLDLHALRATLSSRTKLVAFTAASNLVGTLTPIREIVQMAHAVGAQTFVDAVHYAPHRLIDVAAWGCDYVACSVYKFFGPHVGILWGRGELLRGLDAEKVRPAKDTLPWRFMQGTANHEGIAGTRAAVEYLAALGREVDGRDLPGRAALGAAFTAIEAHESALCARLLAGLRNCPDVRVVGIAEPERVHERTATVAFVHARRSPAELAIVLAEHGICVSSGHAYAIELITALRLEPHGVLRAGMLHYNTHAEVDRLLDAMHAVDDKATSRVAASR